jgi:Fe-S cluster assembly protein SufD
MVQRSAFSAEQAAVNIEQAKAARNMTMQVIRTKAEQALLEMMEGHASSLPGGPAMGAARREAIGRFAALGLPSRRIEEWKYSDVRSAFKEASPLVFWRPGHAAAGRVAVDLAGYEICFLDGRCTDRTADSVSSVVSVQPISAASGPLPDWVERNVADPRMLSGGELALNTALFSDGAMIDVADGAELEVPVVVVADAFSQEPGLQVLRHVVRVGKGAKATIIEIDRAGRTAQRQTSSVTQILVGDGAHVVHVKITDARAGSLHLGHWHAELGREARYQPVHLTVGEGFVRHGLNVAFNGEHTTFDFAGASIVHGSGHADTTLLVDHRVPHCTSRELYKAVLDGAARAVFQGKVIVQPGAQKTDGKQMAQALMLSPDAEFDSKPELEIYADDVVCGHGSTAAEIDPDLVFYCTSRGIPAQQARALLIWSFVAEAIERVEVEAVSSLLTRLARESLGLDM